jgi:hypothetical protein
MKIIFLLLGIIASPIASARVVGPNYHQTVRLTTLPSAHDPSVEIVRVEFCPARRACTIIRDLSREAIERHFIETNYDRAQGEALLAKYYRIIGKADAGIGLGAVGAAVAPAALGAALAFLLPVEIALAIHTPKMIELIDPLHLLLMTDDRQPKEEVYFVNFTGFYERLVETLQAIP